MPRLDEKQPTQPEPILKAGTISFDSSRIDCLVAKFRGTAQILRSKAKSAFPTHSTWLSIQSIATTIVTLSGERLVGSGSRSIRLRSPFQSMSDARGGRCIAVALQ